MNPVESPLVIRLVSTGFIEPDYQCFQEEVQEYELSPFEIGYV